MGFYNGGKRLGSTPSTAKASTNFQSKSRGDGVAQRGVCVSVDGTLLRSNIRSREKFRSISLTGFLMKAGQGSQTSLGECEECTDQIPR